MDINVVKVDVVNSAKFGTKKVLHVDDGTKWNVSEKKPFYGFVNGPGKYNVEIGDFNGTPYIKYLKALDNGSKTPASAVSSASGSGASPDNYKARLAADRMRQNEIALEFYCGLAKDIMIANKKDGEVIDMQEVQDAGWALFKRHKSMLELADMNDQPAKPAEVKSTFQKATEALTAEKAAEENIEPPF